MQQVQSKSVTSVATLQSIDTKVSEIGKNTVSLKEDEGQYEYEH